MTKFISVFIILWLSCHCNIADSCNFCFSQILLPWIWVLELWQIEELIGILKKMVQFSVQHWMEWRFHLIQNMKSEWGKLFLAICQVARDHGRMPNVFVLFSWGSISHSTLPILFKQTTCGRFFIRTLKRYIYSHEVRLCYYFSHLLESCTLC